MKVEYNEESSVKKSLTFEVEPEVVDREIQERSDYYARRVKLPGFRPGKVPKDVIRRRFRQQVLEDVAEKLGMHVAEQIPWNAELRWPHYVYRLDLQEGS